ncbi:sigma-70 family RNA polymerase sigma factor [Flavobacterium sp. ENC]|uniref:sigma-70 family RNA polymerase sigma factor n=1 Tax=Flavobacterium sp. ENC TaxID=2897330 RepID=UPI001E5E0CA1|nr:sigma-70 family RNA polymerase sigma factor [Flavobacterium sp. ENC]MCD0467015.1 sigma-70 family RNA polymerase sigma factor [Flavobacterium sp. ENC]
MHGSERRVDIQEKKKLDPNNWVENYSDYLYSYAAVRLYDDELAKDLVQETFLAALAAMKGFNGLSSEKTWLTAILKHKIADVYRSRSSGLRTNNRAAQGQEEEFFDPDNGHWNSGHNPAEYFCEQPDIIEDREFQAILQACMKKLPALWLAVFTMKHVDEEPSKSICEVMGLSPSNFWVIIHRAKVNLRSCLQKNWI